MCRPLNTFTACIVYILKQVVRSWLQSTVFDNTEWIKSPNKYLPHKSFKRKIIFKAGSIHSNKKNTSGDQVFRSFNQLQIYQPCLLCNRVRDRKYVTATRVRRHA